MLANGMAITSFSDVCDQRIHGTVHRTKVCEISVLILSFNEPPYVFFGTLDHPGGSNVWKPDSSQEPKQKFEHP